MKTRVESHSCADEMWRVVPLDYGQIADCSCARIFKHQPLTWWRLFFSSAVPAISGDLWVDVTRRERTLRRREGRRDGYITGEAERP